MNERVHIAPDELRLMREYVERHCGLALSDKKAYLFETRLIPVMAENGFRSFGELYRAAVGSSSNTLRDAIIDAMTTHETMWFRDVTPFTILDTVVLGEARSTAGSLRVWSAACSTGQEPYSIAMTVLEHAEVHGRPLPRQVEIVASDISTGALYLAKAGRYDQFAMNRGLSAERRDTYFTQAGRVWALRDEIRKMVRFQRHNLQDSYERLGRFDVIYCRNVLIYFGEEFRKDVLYRLRAALKPGGKLFLGAAESVLGSAKWYEPVWSQNGVYYRATKE
jgi:chemotaxis protein methyltransferase CheR